MGGWCISGCWRVHIYIEESKRRQLCKKFNFKRVARTHSGILCIHSEEYRSRYCVKLRQYEMRKQAARGKATRYRLSSVYSVSIQTCRVHIKYACARFEYKLI